MEPLLAGGPEPTGFAESFEPERFEGLWYNRQSSRNHGLSIWSDDEDAAVIKHFNLDSNTGRDSYERATAAAVVWPLLGVHGPEHVIGETCVAVELLDGGILDAHPDDVNGAQLEELLARVALSGFIDIHGSNFVVVDGTVYVIDSESALGKWYKRPEVKWTRIRDLIEPHDFQVSISGVFHRARNHARYLWNQDEFWDAVCHLSPTMLGRLVGNVHFFKDVEEMPLCN